MLTSVCPHLLVSARGDPTATVKPFAIGTHSFVCAARVGPDRSHRSNPEQPPPPACPRAPPDWQLLDYHLPDFLLLDYLLLDALLLDNLLLDYLLDNLLLDYLLPDFLLNPLLVDSLYWYDLF